MTGSPLEEMLNLAAQQKDPERRERIIQKWLLERPGIQKTDTELQRERALRPRLRPLWSSRFRTAAAEALFICRRFYPWRVVG